jgi:hypothetical protein
MWRRALALVAAGAIVGTLVMSSGGTALADYGSGAQYQIEISANCNGPGSCIPTIVKGFGIWFWAELNADGTGDYQAADCGHIGPGNTPGATGAFQDSGDVTWSYTNGGATITIEGAAIFGNTVPMTITVPATLGHSVEPFAQVFDIPALGGALPGTAQVQVAP